MHERGTNHDLLMVRLLNGMKTAEFDTIQGKKLRINMKSGNSANLRRPLALR